MYAMHSVALTISRTRQISHIKCTSLLVASNACISLQIAHIFCRSHAYCCRSPPQFCKIHALLLKSCATLVVNMIL